MLNEGLITQRVVHAYPIKAHSTIPATQSTQSESTKATGIQTKFQYAYETNILSSSVETHSTNPLPTNSSNMSIQSIIASTNQTPKPTRQRTPPERANKGKRTAQQMSPKNRTERKQWEERKKGKGINEGINE